MDVTKITRKQLESVELQLWGKTKWYDKKPHLIKMFNRWKNLDLTITEDNLEEFLNSCKQETKRREIEHFCKSQRGEVQSKYTPADKSTIPFSTVDNPVIGSKYHLSWAFKGAVFRLIKLDQDSIHCYLDNPKYKRKDLLKAKISDLRALR
jgi:hypothetical protein